MRKHALSAHFPVLALVVDSQRGIDFLKDQITILKPTVASQRWVFAFYTNLNEQRPAEAGQRKEETER
jgi:hypothetical protein